jgi:hypothetical protein
MLCAIFAPASHEVTVVAQYSAVPLRRIVTASDAKGYSKRLYDDQRDIQDRMAAIENRAAANAGLSLEHAIIQGRGDGSLTAWPPDTNELNLIVNYLRELHRELERVNAGLIESKKIRMRLAVTTGLVSEAPYGIPGDTAVLATLLVDSDQLRKALDQAPGHPLAVIIDDMLYRDVIKTRLLGLEPDAYKRVTIRDKGGRNHTAWITVPGTAQPALPIPADNARREAGTPLGALAENWDDDGPPPPRRPEQTNKKGKWTIAVLVPIAVALIGAVGAIAAAVIPGRTDGSPTPPSTTPTSSTASVRASASSVGITTGPAPTSSVSVSAKGSPGKLHWEETYNHLGTDVFSDNYGDAVTSGPESIPFGTWVQVKCWAPNNSGMGSINVFYLIETSPWKGDYAPANTFLNGDTSGDLDPKVLECPAS